MEAGSSKINEESSTVLLNLQQDKTNNIINNCITNNTEDND